jgi:2-polyprenyl-6-methoxyphenol hydroxylase-like FAD-dependent oxidoreductase
MLLQNKQVAIVGGGPGGLTLARLLQLNGAAVKVYERDQNRTVRVQGGTLDLHDESGLAALRAAGLLAEFKAHYRPGADKLRLTDKHATVAYDDHAEAPAETFGEAAFRPEIDRGPLRALLLDSL